MKWIKFRIKTVTEAEDILVSNLYDIGLEGAQIEDKVPLTALEKEQMFVDILPDMPDNDDIAYLSCFVEDDGHVDREEIKKNIEEVLKETAVYCEIGEGTVEVSETEDLDWINNWKQFFHQFYIDDLLVIPSWEEVKPEDKDRMILHIDPGTAFGTGMHETTQLCIRALRKYVAPGCSMVDVGTGSGILSIMAYKFGAKKIIGTDLDPCAINAVEDNMNQNNLADAGFELIIGNLIDDPDVQAQVGEGYDIVAANILAGVLIPLMPQGIKCLKDGGIYIMSGIIDEAEESVVSACKENGLEVLEVNHQGEWVGVVAKKPEA